MKTTILVIAILACVALGILGVEQSKKLNTQSDELAQTRQQLAALQTEVQEKSDAVEKARSTETKAKILQQTLAESTTVAVAESKKSAELKASLDEEKTNNPLNAMASMLKDPKMREMMKAQQKAYLGPILDQQYADLYKQLNLTPEKTAAFKDLLCKKMLAGADAGFSMLDNSLDATQRADLAKQVKDQADDLDNQIKQFLGDWNYKAYKSYEMTLPDRMTLSQFNDQIAGTPNALTAGQQEQLIQEMSDARNNFNWTSSLNQQNAGANGDISAMFTQENIDRYLADQERLDQQVLAKAQKILTPAQLAALKDHLKTQRDLQAMGMKMAKGMYTPAAP